jgi:hypothetical protein
MAAPSRMTKTKQHESLNGWQQIAEFLGQPSSVAQRWAKSGMPVNPRGSVGPGFAGGTEPLGSHRF